MAHSLEVLRGALVRQERIVRVWLPGTCPGSRSRHGLRVAELGTSLCDHEVVVSVSLVNVRALGPDSSGAVPEVVNRANRPRLQIECVLLNHLVLGGRDIDRPVVIPEDIRVDAMYREFERIAPRGIVVRIRRGEQQALSLRTQVRNDQVELALMIAQSGRIDTRLLSIRDAKIRDLAGPIENIACQFPVLQISACIKRKTGEGNESGRHAEKGVLLRYVGTAGIGVPTREERIGIRLDTCGVG